MKTQYIKKERNNNYFVNSIKEIRSSIDDVQYENQISVLNSKFKICAINLQGLKTVSKVLRRNQITQKYLTT